MVRSAARPRVSNHEAVTFTASTGAFKPRVYLFPQQREVDGLG